MKFSFYFFLIVEILFCTAGVLGKNEDILDQSNVFEMLDQSDQSTAVFSYRKDEKTKSNDILDKSSIFETLDRQDQKDNFYMNLSFRGGVESYSSKISVMPRVSSLFYFPSIGFVYRNFNEQGHEVMSLNMEVQFNQHFMKLMSVSPYASIGQGYTYWQFESLGIEPGDFGSFSTYLALGFDILIFSGFNLFLQCKYDYYWQGYYLRKLAHQHTSSHKISTQYGVNIKL